MENKLIALVLMGFLVVAGLSIGNVSGLPVNVNMEKNATASVIPPPPPPTRYKIDLVLKVEAVYHEGKVKKFLSYSRYASPPLVDPTGTPPPSQVTPPKRLSEEVPQLPKYTEWFHLIPPPSLSSPILTSVDFTCQKKNDFLLLPTANLSNSVVPPKEYTGILSQCDPTEYPISVEPLPPNKSWFWFLNSCSSSSGNRLISTAALKVFNLKALPLYTIHVGIGTPNNTMLINPVVNFNMPTFLQNFPFDLLGIQSVVIRVALYTDTEKGSLKKVMKNKKYVVQQDEESLQLPFSSDSNCFMVFIYDNKPEPKIGENLDNFSSRMERFIVRYSNFTVVLYLIFCFVWIVVQICKGGNKSKPEGPRKRRRIADGGNNSGTVGAPKEIMIQLKVFQKLN